MTGTGLMTVALGLLAYDLSGENAGLVLGTALTAALLTVMSFHWLFVGATFCDLVAPGSNPGGGTMKSIS